MSSDSLIIPEDLLGLKPSDALEMVSISKLARSGTAVLRRLVETDQPVAVRIQGQGAMVTVSRHQYDEMVELIRELREMTSGDDFTRVLGQRFDSLVARLNRPGAAEKTQAALFGDPAALNQGYRPGDTEDDA